MADGGVINLADRKADRLEHECARLRASNEALVELAKANLAAQAQTHSAVLGVLGADSLLTLDKALAGPVATSLGVDLVRVFVEGQTPLPNAQSIRACAPGLADALLGGQAEWIGPLDTRFADALYAPQTTRMRSEARVGLEMAGTRGVVCLASCDEALFTPGQAGDLLHFFARVLERQISPWLAH